MLSHWMPHPGSLPQPSSLNRLATSRPTVQVVRLGLRGLGALALALQCAFAPCLVTAQEAKPKAKTPPAKAAPAQKKYTVADWPDLVARKQEFLQRTEKLKAQFEAAEKENDIPARQQLIQQFRALQQEFGS